MTEGNEIELSRATLKRIKTAAAIAEKQLAAAMVIAEQIGVKGEDLRGPALRILPAIVTNFAALATRPK